jgi:SagB-type dehydrogenase family enzyme
MITSPRSTVVTVALATVALTVLTGVNKMARGQETRERAISLPEPDHGSGIDVEEALAERRSVRDYSPDPLTLQEISQLLWAAQGVTGTDGERTAPSAGALYPIDLYLAVGNVEDLAPGLYKYRPETHTLAIVAEEDLRKELAAAALDQECVRDGAVAIIITAVYKRTTRKYGERGRRYVHMEAGHVAQNIYIQAASLGLGTVMIGAFEDDDVTTILDLPKTEAALGILPVGRLK